MAISAEDRKDLERLVILNAARGRMVHGPEWEKLLAEQGFAKETDYFAVLTKLFGRFHAEPELAQAHAELQQAMTSADWRKNVPDEATAKAFAAEVWKHAEEPEPGLVEGDELVEREAAKVWDAEATEPLVALAGLLSRKHEKGLAAELRLAVTDPRAYVDRFRPRLALRGIRGPVTRSGASLPWVALVDGLAARRQLAELDWRESSEDVLAALGATRTGLFGKKELRSVGAEDLETEALLRAVAEHLARAGVGAIILDLQSDSFPIAFFRTEDDVRLKALATECERAGFGAARAP